MEQQFFICEGLEQFDSMAVSYRNCELLVPLGPLPAGTKVPFINVYYNLGVMDFFCEEGDDATHSFDLHLTAEYIKDE